MLRLSRFQAMPFRNAAWYEPVRSNTLPDIQPPSAMPSRVNIRIVPVRAPASAAGKCSRTMIAYDGTIPPWKMPNSADTT